MGHSKEKYCEYCFDKLAFDRTCENCSLAQEYHVQPHHISVGTTLNGKYIVGKALGEGGFGITYIGLDKNLDMKVAIKEYYPNGIVNRNNTISLDVTANIGDTKNIFESGKEKFIQEARVLAKFSGESGIVGVRDFFVENNTAYIVMEYLEGITLKEYMKEKGILPFSKVIDLLKPIIEALEKIHDTGLIHRDISPDNIMIVKGTAKLIDFGAARDISNTDDKTLSVMLKPSYAPEEQYRGKSSQGPWTDVYALCATIYKCVTGVTPEDSIQRVFQDDLKKPSELGIAINSIQETALLKGMAVLKADRIQNMSELKIELYNLASTDDGKTVAGVSSIDEQQKIIKRNEAEIPSNLNKNKSQAADVEVDKNGIKDRKDKNKEAKNPPHKKKKGGFLKVVAISIFVIIGIIAFSAVYNSLSKITIGNITVNKNADSFSISKQKLTEDDFQKLQSMPKLVKLTLVACLLTNEDVNTVSKIETLKSLNLEGNTDITDISSLKSLKYLSDLNISYTSVSDLSRLSEIQYLNVLNISNIAVNSLDTLGKCEYLVTLTANGNELTNLSALENIPKLCSLKVSNNKISNLDGVEKCEALQNIQIHNNALENINSLNNLKYLITFEADNNKITDISTLSNKGGLLTLSLNKNSISDISPLSGNMKLTYLYLAQNKIVNIDPLKTLTKIKSINLSENHVTSIDGISNCAILESVFLQRNNISDVSILGKSTETLRIVYLSNNNISDISCLKGAVNLTTIDIGNNKISDISFLGDCKKLKDLLANNNNIDQLPSFETLDSIERILLGNNQISDISGMENINNKKTNLGIVIYLQNNKISNVSYLPIKTKIAHLNIAQNPITDFSHLKNLQIASPINRLDFTYSEGVDYSFFRDTKFKYFCIVDAPLDQQEKIKKKMGDSLFGISNIGFATSKEVSKEYESSTKSNEGGETNE